jgi:hypothetical protein
MDSKESIPPGWESIPGLQKRFTSTGLGSSTVSVKKGKTRFRKNSHRFWEETMQITDLLPKNAKLVSGQRVHCIMYSVVFTPSPPSHHVRFGSYLSSLYSSLTLHRWCGLVYPYGWRDFVGTKKKTIVGLLIFNPLWVRG